MDTPNKFSVCGKKSKIFKTFYKLSKSAKKNLEIKLISISA